MIELNTFKELMEENEDCLPLLTLEEFFCENPNEDAIAPNQCGYGRPSLSEIWGAFQNIEQMPNVAWVRVALHDDTEIEECDGEEELYLSGDSIIICTSAQVSDR